MKRFIIRWAIKKMLKLRKDLSYHELRAYGIQDIIKNKHTGEDMYIF